MSQSQSQSQLKAESVSKNPFFQVLRQTYNELYSLAAKRGWKICVPHSTTISGATLNEHFFKSHILQSSPYFKEEYVTLNGQCVIYKNGIISTKTGFESPRKVYVLGEELFYTQDFKSFTVYCISSPLIGIYNNGIIIEETIQTHSFNKTQSKHSNHNNNNNKLKSQEKIVQIAIEDRNEKHWKQLLSLSLQPIIFRKMMQEIVNFADQFNRSYVMIKGYTKSASKRIEEFRNNTFDQLLINPNKYNNKKNKNKHKHFNKNELDELQSSFDSYLNYILFDRIFNFLIRHYKCEDNLFSNQLMRLKGLSQETIGIKKQFQSKSNFKSAVRQLSNINNFQSPINKLGVLKQTFTLIRDCIEQNKKNHDHNEPDIKKEEMALTTDDMLSLFTFVLIHSNIKYIVSNNEYLKYFYFQLHCTAHLDYYAATFQATMLYIKNQLFQSDTSTNGW